MHISKTKRYNGLECPCMYIEHDLYIYKQSMKLKIMSSCPSIWIMNSYVLFFIYLVCVSLVAPKFLVFGLCFSFSFFFFLKSQAYKFRNHIQGNKYYLLFWLLSASNVLALKIWYSQFFCHAENCKRLLHCKFAIFKNLLSCRWVICWNPLGSVQVTLLLKSSKKKCISYD